MDGAGPRPALGGFGSPRTPTGAAGLEENLRGAFAKLPKTLVACSGNIGEGGVTSVPLIPPTPHPPRDE